MNPEARKSIAYMCCIFNTSKKIYFRALKIFYGMVYFIVMRNKLLFVMVLSFLLAVSNRGFCESENELIEEEDNPVTEEVSLDEDYIEVPEENFDEDVSPEEEVVETFSRSEEITGKMRENGISEDEADSYITDMLREITENADNSE